MKYLLLALFTLMAFPSVADKTLYLHYSEFEGRCTLVINRQEDGGQLEDSGCSEPSRSLCERDAKPDACVCLKRDKKLKWKASRDSRADGVDFTIRFHKPDSLDRLQPFKNENRCGPVMTFQNSQSCQIAPVAQGSPELYQYDVSARKGNISCEADPRVVVEM